MFCKNYNCELSESACFKRQKLAKSDPVVGGDGLAAIRGSLCKDCSTGREIRDTFEKTKIAIRNTEKEKQPEPEKPEPKKDTCAKCDKPIYCKGFCVNHYQQHVRKRNKTRAVAPMAEKEAGIQIPKPEKSITQCHITITINFDDCLIRAIKALTGGGA